MRDALNATGRPIFLAIRGNQQINFNLLQIYIQNGALRIPFSGKQMWQTVGEQHKDQHLIGIEYFTTLILSVQQILFRHILFFIVIIQNNQYAAQADQSAWNDPDGKQFHFIQKFLRYHLFQYFKSEVVSLLIQKRFHNSHYGQ